MLWRSSFTYLVTRVLKVNACAQIFTAQIGVQWSVFCATHRRTDGYVVTEGCCCNFSQTPYVTKRNASSQQQVPCRGASSSRLAPNKDPRQICCHGSSCTNVSSRWRVRAVVITSLSAGPCSPLPGLDSLGASPGSLLNWTILFEVWPCCAIACMNCSCCEINVCSKTLARASTLTCNL